MREGTDVFGRHRHFIRVQRVHGQPRADQTRDALESGDRQHLAHAGGERERDAHEGGDAGGDAVKDSDADGDTDAVCDGCVWL